MENRNLRNFILDFFALLINTDSLETFKTYIKLALFLVSAPTRTNPVVLCSKQFDKLRTNMVKQTVKEVLEEKGKVKDEKENDVTEEIGVDEFCDFNQFYDDEQDSNATQDQVKKQSRRSQISDYVEFIEVMKTQVTKGQQQTQLKVMYQMNITTKIKFCSKNYANFTLHHHSGACLGTINIILHVSQI